MTAQAFGQSGSQWKTPVLCATAAALPSNSYTAGVLTATASGALTIDGVSPPAGSRVLVTSEAAAANNGTYVVTTPGSGSTPYVLTRTPDMAQGSQVPGAVVLSEQGAVNGSTLYTTTSTGTIVIGTSPVTWITMPTGRNASGPSDWQNTATQYGADKTGATDATSAISTTLGNGGVTYLEAGTYLLNGSSGLSLGTAGTKLYGAGTGLTTILVGSGFTGTSAVAIAADHCEIAGLSVVGANTGTATNLGGSHAWNGIEISGGWQHCRVRSIFTQFVNGWALEPVGGSSRANLDLIVDGWVSRNCAGSIHAKGVTGSSFGGEHFFTNIQIQQCGTTTGPSANLDAMRLEDIRDVVTVSINTGLSAGTGSSVNTIGASTACYFALPDLGGGSPTVAIQAGSNGSPTDIRFTCGTMQESTSGANLAVSGASGGLYFGGIYFHASNGDGITATNTGPPSEIDCCRWNTNGQGTTGSTAFCDLNTSGATAKWDITGGNFGTTIGTSSGNVLAPVTDTSGVAVFAGTRFSGTGTTTSNFGAVNYSGCTVGTTLGLTSVPVRGQILTVNQYAPGTQTLLTSTAQAFAAVSSANANTSSFVAPASGSVLVTASFITQSSSSSDAIAFALCAHGTTTPLVGTVVEWKPSTTTPGPATVQFLVTGLTAGTAYNLDLMFAVQSGGTVTVYAFGQTATSPVLSSSGVGSAVVMTVQAL